MDDLEGAIQIVKKGFGLNNDGAKILVAEIEHLTEELEYSQKLFEQLTGGQEANKRPGREM